MLETGRIWIFNEERPDLPAAGAEAHECAVSPKPEWIVATVLCSPPTNCRSKDFCSLSADIE
jgi:hypothetical protein